MTKGGNGAKGCEIFPDGAIYKVLLYFLRLMFRLKKNHRSFFTYERTWKLILA
jgi:hypothetical protein